jgi:hypothetical protein
MTDQNPDPPARLFNVGDRVMIRLFGGLRGRVVELRGPLGPGGVQMYRVMVRRMLEPMYIAVGADQLVPLPAER